MKPGNSKAVQLLFQQGVHIYFEGTVSDFYVLWGNFVSLLFKKLVMLGYWKERAVSGSV